MATIFCLVETELCTTCDNFKLVTHISVQCISKVDGPRNTINKRNHVHGETGLQRCHLVQVVENHVCVRIALQQDGKTCLTAGRTIVHVGDTFKFAAIDKFLNTCSNRRAAGLVRKFCHQNFHAACAVFFNDCLGACLNASASSAICILNTRATKNETTCWEVWPRHELHEVFWCCLWIIDEVQRCINHFAQVVRRNAGGHTNGNTLAAVHQQVGETCRKNLWFF